MEYTVVVRLSITTLVEEVNRLINDGWTPFGSLAVDGTERNVEYLQPMVRYISTVKEKKHDFTADNIPATP